MYGALPNSAGTIGVLAWIYSTAIVLIGIGLHPFLGRWTTASLVALFVMLNFTSSGGIFAPALQPGFFASLHSFWIGSGLVEAGRDLMYFPGLGIGRHVVVLLLWLAAGVGLSAIAAAAERRRTAAGTHAARRPPAPAPAPATVERPAADAVEKEIEETVAA
jgi:hypothetical protein